MISRNIDASRQDNRLDMFESAMKPVATTLVREAKFDTTDYATAKQRGCEGFTLLLGSTRPESGDAGSARFRAATNASTSSAIWNR